MITCVEQKRQIKKKKKQARGCRNKGEGLLPYFCCLLFNKGTFMPVKELFDDSEQLF